MTEKTNFQVLEGKQVLLTGGCGFIGSEVTKQLSEFGADYYRGLYNHYHS